MTPIQLPGRFQAVRRMVVDAGRIDPPSVPRAWQHRRRERPVVLVRTICHLTGQRQPLVHDAVGAKQRGAPSRQLSRFACPQSLGNLCNGDDVQSLSATLGDANSLVREQTACALTTMLDQVP